MKLNLARGFTDLHTISYQKIIEGKDGLLDTKNSIEIVVRLEILNYENKKIQNNILVIGGAGFIGSFVVSELLKHPVQKIIVYDNFARGNKSYLVEQLKDECTIFPFGGRYS